VRIWSAQPPRPTRGPQARGTATADGPSRFRRCHRHRGSSSHHPPELASRRSAIGRACSPLRGTRPRPQRSAAPAKRPAASAPVHQLSAGLRRAANRGPPHTGQ
jgi:hypothetical protein